MTAPTWPHLQIGEVQAVTIQAANGRFADTYHQAATACGKEKPPAVLTTERELVRCLHCLAATEAPS